MKYTLEEFKENYSKLLSEFNIILLLLAFEIK